MSFFRQLLYPFFVYHEEDAHPIMSWQDEPRMHEPAQQGYEQTCGFHNDMQKMQILEILVY